MCNPVEPSTAAEWQEAVDAAHGALMLDSARRYGLVTGGPEVNVGRCEQILAGGIVRGIAPSSDAVERFVRSLLVSPTLAAEVDTRG